MLLLVPATLLAVSLVVPTLADVRVIHIAPTGDARMTKLAECLADKLTAGGRFAVAPTSEQADAVLHIIAKIPSGSSRVLWGKAPEVNARLLSKDGVQIWSGKNKYKKSTTMWGTGTDVECGLANGLAAKLTGPS